MESGDTSPLTARRAREVATISQVGAKLEVETETPRSALIVAGRVTPSNPVGRNKKRIRLFMQVMIRAVFCS